MKHASALIAIACASLAHAQPWSYVGGSCALPSGSAEMEFRTDGTAIAVSFETFGLHVREWNGSAWSTLPAPAGVSGLIGGFDLEMHNDVAYLAVSNTQLKVYRLDAGAWTALGAGITGTWSTNYDFVVDNNGVPKVVHGFDRKLYVFDGAAWSNTYTFPQGSWPAIISYGITGDHTLGVDAANRLIYVISMNNRQLMRAYDGASETLVGDTITPHAAFSPFQCNVFRNGADELFVTLQSFGGTPFIKQLQGSAWAQFGDSTNSALGGGNMLLAFRGDDAPVLGNLGSVGKSVYAVNGPGSPFVQLDTLSHSGFAQLTDLDVDPTDGSVHATFNCLPTAAVMRYDAASTVGEGMHALLVSVHPNPANSSLRIESNEAITRIRLFDALGHLVSDARPLSTTMDVSMLPSGLYTMEVNSLGVLRGSARFMKE